VESAELVPEPGAGRVFERDLRPGIADAIGDGRVRLDAIARWLQDVAYADLIDAGFEERGVWIVRRMRLRVESWPRFGEPVAVRTFCSGLGRFSAERRTSVRSRSAAVDAVALWVWIDESGRPGRFDERFKAIYAESAGERGARVRLRHPDPPAEGERRPWTFRAADLDVAGHVNNSHYWEPLEELFAGSEPGPLDAEIEHRDPAVDGPAFVTGGRDALWVQGADGAVHASIQILPS
jgi:acyl-ACP thioesterase